MRCTCGRKMLPPGKNRPKLPSSALHTMAILQVHQAKALKELHKGSPDPTSQQPLNAHQFERCGREFSSSSCSAAASTQPGKCVFCCRYMEQGGCSPLMTQPQHQDARLLDVATSAPSRRMALTAGMSKMIVPLVPFMWSLELWLALSNPSCWFIRTI